MIVYKEIQIISDLFDKKAKELEEKLNKNIKPNIKNNNQTMNMPDSKIDYSDIDDIPLRSENAINN